MKIDIPCRVGDTVWGICKAGGKKVALCGKVTEIYFSDPDMKPAIRVHRVCTGHWGDNVFATEQEVVERIEALNRRENRPLDNLED